MRASACPAARAAAASPPNILMFGDYAWVPHRTQPSALPSRRGGRAGRRRRRLAVLELGAGRDPHHPPHLRGARGQGAGGPDQPAGGPDRLPHVSLAAGALEGSGRWTGAG